MSIENSYTFSDMFIVIFVCTEASGNFSKLQRPSFKWWVHDSPGLMLYYTRNGIQKLEMMKRGIAELL